MVRVLTRSASADLQGGVSSTLRTCFSHRGWPIALAGVAAVATLRTLSACAMRTPEGVQAVTDFDVDRYAGRWIELARIDHRFEKGLIHTGLHSIA